ncbi:NAD(P)H-binding protein [Hoylesella nanceiensis]|uniref:NAD(P)-dependent oxidoreductase n=1 Tax=Hoylesella nanceiensis TaxID=425941 RepID=UPI0028E8B5D8|nr:NAD(P)H-binding protein [Hoylesella nanceiensis]
MKDIILIGASGFVGSAILEEALNRGHKVTALVRNPEKIQVKNENLTVLAVDATDVEALSKVVAGKDAVISAYNPGWGNPRLYEEILENYPKIIEGVKKAGVQRLLVVGGAGVLYVQPGMRLMDSGTLPAELMPAVNGEGELFLNVLSKENDIDWVYFAPPANLGNMGKGVRTGKYRLGTDTLLTDEKGDSFISVEDYAVAMIDELEQEAHHKTLFTAAY